MYSGVYLCDRILGAHYVSSFDLQIAPGDAIRLLCCGHGIVHEPSHMAV